MTLLEVVLAVTILAAMSGLIATLWMQANRMADDGMGQNRSLRLTRILEMIRSQWADRRTSIPLGKSGASVAVEPGVLTFISATAILEPGWPLVRARYIVERDYTTRPGMPTAWRLTYEELPIVDLAAPLDQSRTGPAAADRPVGAPREKRVVLLAACTELSWQRFGLSDALENADAAQDEADPNPEPKAAVRPHPGRPSDQDKQPAWRELDAAFRGRTRAIRLTGTLEQQEFSCILIIGDSR